MMLVLKLPLLYLGLVCWWAIRAEPKPLEPRCPSCPSSLQSRGRGDMGRGPAVAAARTAGTELRPHHADGGDPAVSASTTSGSVERTSPAEAVGGFLAAASMALSAVAMVYRPVRLVPFALVIAFIAVGLTSGRHARLAASAVAVGALAWLVGMTSPC